ncbi:DegT/DnrJ/EryC1/StrS family aminotransferase [Prochlorococcus marinus]|uniref:DegT/DnrJ/EryC1/StrS aminotransferase family enzyme n=1 Tax=Prochlorococcus marinus (strain MIT 9211) TaxID=93059 RepID=A9BA45_PROM4|nr:DegT/DnrJ/EryC1/StrS family aminotransferase [Prochlorococcus marinus]ABX08707.1 Hypothetical protein P9211_07761 [Prochlorococcus marinus str. MIT 9211]
MTTKSKSFYFNQARFGLIWSLAYANSPSKSTVILLPELICNSLTDVLFRAGYQITYYKIDSTLNPCVESIEKHFSKTSDIKALIYVNYFGIPAKVELIRKLCTEKDVLLIEDNSHGFGGQFEGSYLGEKGDISISSPRKSYSSAIGGVISINSKNLLLNDFKNQPYNQLNYSKIPITHMHKIDNIFLQSIRNNFRIKKLSFIEQNDPYAFREKPPRDIYLGPIAEKYRYFVDWKMIRKTRINGWNLTRSMCKKLGIKPIFENSIDQLCPWAYPAFCKNINERNDWIKFFYSRSLAAFSWPCLPNEQIISKKDALEYWKNIICIPLNNISIRSVKRIYNKLS